MHLKAGVDALDRGEFVEIDEPALERFLEQMTSSPRSGTGR
jgi:hypothetical protein